MGKNSEVTAAIYTRISFDRTGEGLGVERQQTDCQALADRLGWTVVGRFDDNDLSAMSAATRPGFEALLDAIKRGEVNAVLCWQPDRLYRRVADLARLLDLPGVQIRTVNGGDLDLSNSTGRMLATILGSVATQESELKAERQRRAAQQLAERGRPHWRCAFGYLPYTGTKADDTGVREVDPVNGPAVAGIYQGLLAGVSISALARDLNADGALGASGKPWTASTLSLFLRKARNAGLREYGGKIVGPGTWPALVDESTWQAAQSVLGAPGRAPGRKSVRKHLLTGVLQCGNPGCGGHLSGQWVMQSVGARPGRPGAGEVRVPRREQPKRAHSIAYQCKRCRRNSIRAHHVEPLVYGVVIGRLAEPDAVDLLRAKQFDPAEAKRLGDELQALYALVRVANDEYDDGIIDGRRLQARRDRVAEKIAAIQRRQQDAERLRVFDGIPLGTPEVDAAIRALSPDRLRAVIAVLVDFVVASTGKAGKTFNPERVTVNWR